MVDQRDTSEVRDVRRHLCCPGLPLAIYQEVAAHLRQVDGVETGLVPQSSQQFDYAQSQVGALWIQYPPHTSEQVRQQIERILAYYGDRYGAWLVASC